MIEQVRGLAFQRLLVVAERGDDGLSAFLAELARATFDAGVEQLLGIGRAGGLLAPRADQPRQALQDVIEFRASRHQASKRRLPTYARSAARARAPQGRGSRPRLPQEWSGPPLQLRCGKVVKSNLVAPRTRGTRTTAGALLLPQPAAVAGRPGRPWWAYPTKRVRM